MIQLLENVKIYKEMYGQRPDPIHFFVNFAVI